MSIVNDTSFSFNKQFKYNFNGGELSSDGGLFLLKEFASRIGFEKVIRDNFQTNDPAVFRIHTDDKNLMQRFIRSLPDTSMTTMRMSLPRILCSARSWAKTPLLPSPRYRVFSIVWMRIPCSSSRRSSAFSVIRSMGSGLRKTSSWIWTPRS